MAISSYFGVVSDGRNDQHQVGRDLEIAEWKYYTAVLYNKTLNFKFYSLFLIYVKSIEVQADWWHGLHRQMRNVSGSFLLIHSVGIDESPVLSITMLNYQLLLWKESIWN